MTIDRNSPRVVPYVFARVIHCHVPSHVVSAGGVNVADAGLAPPLIVPSGVPATETPWREILNVGGVPVRSPYRNPSFVMVIASGVWKMYSAASVDALSVKLTKAAFIPLA